MHYLIDGYNLLFRLRRTNKEFQKQREDMIHDLSRKISLVKLEVSLVFDAPFHVGDRTRSHYNELEILFTAEGETADEYIIDEIENHSHPQQETVVTSDKMLARLVRSCSAHTKSIEEFLLSLDRAYKKKIRQEKSDRHFPPSPSCPRLSSRRNPLIASKAVHFGNDLDYYQHVFESEWEEITRQEESLKNAFLLPSEKQHPRQPKQHRDPFETLQIPEERAATEMERWLKLFEKHLADREDNFLH